MKLTQEDVKKYGTIKEISELNKSKIYFYLESMVDKILAVVDEPNSKEIIFRLVRDIYESGELQDTL